MSVSLRTFKCCVPIRTDILPVPTAPSKRSRVRAAGRSVRIALASLLLVAEPGLALEFNNGGFYDPARHDRFTAGSYPANPVANPEFFLSAHAAQLTGVGWGTDYPERKVTLISPQHFLNADHFRVAGSASFLDASGVVRTFAIASNEAVSGDVAIGTLETPIPSAFGVHHFPVAPISGSASIGREVLYVGNGPGSIEFSAGRTALASVYTTTARFDSSLTAAANTADRVLGIAGDSGAPSFFEEADGLALVGHHYGNTWDTLTGLSAPRAAVSDYLAADGYVLAVHGQAHVGDPSAGDLVVTGLNPERRLDFGPGSGTTAIVRTVRIHDFSGSGATVSVSVSGSGLALRIPGTANLLPALALATPLDAGGASLEVVFTPSGGAPATGLLVVSTGTAGHDIAIGDAQIPVPPGSASLLIDPVIQIGMSGGGSTPGDTQDFAVTLINNDASGAAPASFDLSTGCPIAVGVGCAAGWSVVFDRTSVTLLPGEATIVVAAVTPATGSMAALYAFVLEARRIDAPGFGASAKFLYLVTGTLPADSTPPTAPAGFSAFKFAGISGMHAVLQWNASLDDVGVANYEVEQNGAIVGTPINPAWVELAFLQDTTYTYLVRAVDAAGNRSAATQVSVRNGVIL